VCGRIAFAVLSAALIAGCGGNAKPDAQGTPATTATTPAVNSPNPTPTEATPTTLTREQAAKRYLAIIAASNAVFDEPKCAQSEDFFVNGGLGLRTVTPSGTTTRTGSCGTATSA
jgi:hypothetical protein